MSYNSKYTGKQVESYIDKVALGELATTSALNDKVDKVSGKQLTTEDFTSALKAKLEGLSNYDDTELSNALSTLRGDFDKLVSGDTTTAIKTFNEVIAFLDGVQDTQDLSSIIASIEQQIAAMERVIPTKVSELDNDEGYLTEHQDVSGKLDKTEAASTYLTKADAQTTYLGINGKAKSAEWADKATQATKATQDAAGRNLTVTYATKAELDKKQGTISDLETIRSGAALGATALQSEQYKGTVTGVKINGTTKNPSSGVVDLGYINKQLSTSTSSAMTLSPNIYYRNTSTSLSALTITLGSVSNSNIINEYFVEFTTSSSGTTVSLPSTIIWANGEAPTFEASTTYQISIVNNLGVVIKFK